MIIQLHSSTDSVMAKVLMHESCSNSHVDTTVTPSLWSAQTMSSIRLPRVSTQQLNAASLLALLDSCERQEKRHKYILFTLHMILFTMLGALAALPVCYIAFLQLSMLGC